MADDAANLVILELASELTIAWLANPNTQASIEEVLNFLTKSHGALSALGSAQNGDTTTQLPHQEFVPAVTVRKSLSSKDHLISLIDGKPYRTLKRHLAGHGLTPDQYRERYGLRSDYPMVSETYSQVRRDMAKKIGLGRKAGHKVTTAKAPKPRGRKAAKPAT